MPPGWRTGRGRGNRAGCPRCPARCATVAPAGCSTCRSAPRIKESSRPRLFLLPRPRISLVGVLRLDVLVYVEEVVWVVRPLDVDEAVVVAPVVGLDPTLVVLFHG